MDYPVPVDEDERLSELEKYQVLDTLSEEAYDNIVQIASTIFDTPIALVSLVDKDRQWFKAKVGLDLEETPRNQAFCTYNILDDDIMIVEDALNDDRFRDNPLVLQHPEIRFYAGAPLITDNNQRLGSLCVIDNKPRELSSEQLELLRVLSRQVSLLLEIRYMTSQITELKEENEQLKVSISMCSWCKKVKSSNDKWENIDTFMTKEIGQAISHGICTECFQEFTHGMID